MRLALPFFLLLLPFFVFPWLGGDIHAGAEAYLLFFFSLGLFLVRALKGGSLKVDSSLLLWIPFVFALAISAAMSKDPASAFLVLGVLIASLLFFALVCDYAASSADARDVIMRTLLWLAVLCAILGLGQFFDYALLGRRTGMVILYLLPHSWGARISGPFGQPNFHALLMLSGLCAFGYVYFLKIDRNNRWWVRVGVLAPAFLLWLNFFLTDSRGGKVALVAVLTVLICFLWRSRGHIPADLCRKKGLLLAATGVAGYVAAKLLIAFIIAPQVIANLRAAQLVSITSRLNAWMASLLMTADHPLFGIGLDNFKNYLYEYQIIARDLIQFEYEDLLYTRWAHSEYLQVLAEGGIISFFLLLALLFSLAFAIRKKLTHSRDPGDIFPVLCLVPFFVQAAFDWPLRYPAFLALCLAVLPLTLPRERLLEIRLNTSGKTAVALFCSILLMLGGWVFYWDCQVGVLKDRIGKKEMVAENFTFLKELSTHPSVEFSLLSKGLVPFVNHSVRTQDADLAGELVPLLERGIYLEGAYWQWYNLAHVLLVAERNEDSKKAVTKVIDLNPVYQPAWNFLHYLNVLEASRKTGLPIESFYTDQQVDLEIPDVRNFSPEHQ